MRAQPDGNEEFGPYGAGRVPAIGRLLGHFGVRIPQQGIVPADLDRVLAYLHDAYDVGIDQMRVIDEIVRLTASFGRIPDCLAALEVKAEILEMQAQNATPQRQAPPRLCSTRRVRDRRAHLTRDNRGPPRGSRILCRS